MSGGSAAVLRGGYYGATNAPGTCLYCGRKLTKRARERYEFFDTWACAGAFALVFAREGRRLKPAQPKG